MRQHRKNKIIAQRGPQIAALLSVLVSSTAVAAWPQAISECRVFDKNRLADTRAHWASGPVVSLADETGYEAVKGPRDTLVDAGRLTSAVYDCPKRLTAFGVAADIRRQLRDEGWRQDFACSGPACGDAEGWAVLFPELRTTPQDDTYSYGLLHRSGKRGNTRLAVFTADIDERPRVIVRRLAVDPASPLKLELDLSAVRPVYAERTPAARATFESGSADFDASERFVELIKAADTDAQWVIVGHADRRGNEANNALLAWRRVQTVSEILQEHGVNDARISRYAVSDLMHPRRADATELDLYRRVDLFRLSRTGTDDKQNASAAQANTKEHSPSSPAAAQIGDASTGSKKAKKSRQAPQPPSGNAPSIIRAETLAPN